jgi:hypothetical protein
MKPEDKIKKMAEKEGLHAKMTIWRLEKMCIESTPRHLTDKRPGPFSLIMTHYTEGNFSSWDLAADYNHSRNWAHPSEHAGWLDEITDPRVGQAIRIHLLNENHDVIILQDLKLVVTFEGWPKGETGRLMKLGTLPRIFDQTPAKGLIDAVRDGRV